GVPHISRAHGRDCLEYRGYRPGRAGDFDTDQLPAFGPESPARAGADLESGEPALAAGQWHPISRRGRLYGHFALAGRIHVDRPGQPGILRPGPDGRQSLYIYGNPLAGHWPDSARTDGDVAARSRPPLLGDWFWLAPHPVWCIHA